MRGGEVRRQRLYAEALVEIGITRSRPHDQVPGTEAPRAGLTPGRTVTLTWDGGEVAVPFVTTFGEVAPGQPLCYRDSGDWVALAVAGGDAARRFGLRPGTRMTLIVT